MRLQDDSSLRILSSKLAGNLVLKPRSFLVQGYSLIIPQILRSLSVRMVVRIRLILSYSLSIKEIQYKSISMATHLWHSFQVGSLKIAWKVVRLTLRRTFTTAHSSSDTRDNFFFRISSEQYKEEGFGQCGLPPKKPLCYLADLNDCKEFAGILEKELSKNQEEIQSKKLEGFNNILLKDVPLPYFQYLYEQNLKDEQSVYILKDLLKILCKIYEIKRPQFKAAISAIEFALFDFYSKILKLSLTSFIFGDKQQQQQSYSFYTLSYQVDPESMISNALQFLPFTPYLKIKFVDKIDALLVLLTSLEERTNGRVKGYIIDANASWKAESFALLNQEIISQKYSHFYKKIMYIEQPFPIQMQSQEEKQWKKLKLISNIKIMIDESFSSYEQLPTCFDFGHAINIKSEKAGGPISCLRAALEARKYGMQVMLGSMVSTHLGCTQTYSLNPLTAWLDVDGSLLVESPVFSGGFGWGADKELVHPKEQYFGLQIDTSEIK